MSLTRMPPSCSSPSPILSSISSSDPKDFLLPEHFLPCTMRVVGSFNLYSNYVTTCGTPSQLPCATPSVHLCLSWRHQHPCRAATALQPRAPSRVAAAPPPRVQSIALPGAAPSVPIYPLRRRQP